jgi:hypothetical protein
MLVTKQGLCIGNGIYSTLVTPTSNTIVSVHDVESWDELFRDFDDEHRSC